MRQLLLFKQSTERLWTLEDRKCLHYSSWNRFLTDFLILCKWTKECAWILLSPYSRRLTPDFLYILAFAVKTEKKSRFSNWAIELNLERQIKNHTNKYRTKEKFGCSSYSLFARVIATDPVAEEQFSLLVLALLLLFFSVLIRNCKAR